MRIILASASPRRREILKGLNVDFEIIVSNADESSDKTDAGELCMELSKIKAQSVAKELNDKDALIIGCDTVVVKDGKILGKPKNRDDAFNMIKFLQNDEHSVISGLTLIYSDKIISAFEETKVVFDKMSTQEIQAYVDTGECDDKAGGYAIQGLAAPYIKGIDGCYYNVVGLPVNLLKNMAKNLGVSIF